ncbi:MAG TPA: ATP-binding protein [Geobacteraceae bacterium]|nr:ATP-binding protein [Geobacteraceae bacterium]
MALLVISILAISLFHYFTPLHLHHIHDIFQRLYYLPIILAALWFGLRGGVGTALAVSIVYAPHILFQWGGQLTVEMEKYLEILLYNVVGCLTGFLAQREREWRVELQRSAEGLAESYRKLQQQSERIIAVEEQLRRAERLSTLGEMAAVLAHEIRNPLGSIRGTAEILRDDYPAGSPKHEFIDIQIRETERLNRVVEDFLRMARPQQSEKKRCSLREELETIVTLTAGSARGQQIELELEPIDGELPLLGDGEKLRQAFLNILINALQATPSGGRVVINARRVDGSATISFRDSGTGIDADARARIFEPFFTTKADGTGLGLAVTKKIIEAHGGTLEVESTPGQGTTVIISLALLSEGTG